MEIKYRIAFDHQVKKMDYFDLLRKYRISGDLIKKAMVKTFNFDVIPDDKPIKPKFLFKDDTIEVKESNHIEIDYSLIKKEVELIKKADRLGGKCNIVNAIKEKEPVINKGIPIYIYNEDLEKERS
jgi:hypothetical protein